MQADARADDRLIDCWVCKGDKDQWRADETYAVFDGNGSGNGRNRSGRTDKRHIALYLVSAR